MVPNSEKGYREGLGAIRTPWMYLLFRRNRRLHHRTQKTRGSVKITYGLFGHRRTRKRLPISMSAVAPCLDSFSSTQALDSLTQRRSLVRRLTSVILFVVRLCLFYEAGDGALKGEPLSHLTISVSCRLEYGYKGAC